MRKRNRWRLRAGGLERPQVNKGIGIGGYGPPGPLFGEEQKRNLNPSARNGGVDPLARESNRAGFALPDSTNRVAIGADGSDVEAGFRSGNWSIDRAALSYVAEEALRLPARQ